VLLTNHGQIPFLTEVFQLVYGGNLAFFISGRKGKAQFSLIKMRNSVAVRGEKHGNSNSV
ncbi:MAG: hypothetical protein NTU79_17805, partial [Planctomycetota bacterium]|nr:hypothetical protein [Planctomycetota bacterium]